MQFSDATDGKGETPLFEQTSDDAVTVDNDEPVSRADFDSLRRKVDELESRLADHDAAYELESTSDDFGGLTRDEFLQELADAVYGNGIRPVRPGQFDAKSNDDK